MTALAYIVGVFVGAALAAVVVVAREQRAPWWVPYAINVPLVTGGSLLVAWLTS